MICDSLGCHDEGLPIRHVTDRKKYFDCVECKRIIIRCRACWMQFRWVGRCYLCTHSVHSEFGVPSFPGGMTEEAMADWGSLYDVARRRYEEKNNWR